MLNQEQLLNYLEVLNDKLNKKDENVDIVIYGEDVMILAHDEKNVTLNTVFSPKREIDEYVKEIAKEYDLKEDWLTASVTKVTIKEEENEKNKDKHFNQFLKRSNLGVYVAKPEYIEFLKEIKKGSEEFRKKYKS